MQFVQNLTQTLLYPVWNQWVHKEDPVLINEPLPEKQVRKYNHALNKTNKKNSKKKNKPFVRIWPKEDPMVVSGPQDVAQFQNDRGFESLLFAIQSIGTAGIKLAINSGCGIGSALDYTNYYRPPSDSELLRWMDTGPMSQLIVGQNKENRTINLMAYDTLKTMDGMKSCGVKLSMSDTALKQITLKYRNPKNKDNHSNNHTNESFICFTVTPRDKAWDACKMLFLHNINHALVLHLHPVLHVHVAEIFRLLEIAIPDSHHPVRVLMAPHAKYTNAVNTSVLNDVGSILAKHKSPFSPFDIMFGEMHRFHLSPAERHSRINLAYQFDTNPTRCTTYDRMMNEYQGIITGWIKTWIANNWYSNNNNNSANSSSIQSASDSSAKTTIPALHKDAGMKRWWRRMRDHYGRNQLRPWTKHLTAEMSILLLSTLIFMCSIEHSVHHHLYACIPPECKPWRWNGRLPLNAQDDGANPELTSTDYFQAQSTNTMFFDNHVATYLEEVKYGGYDSGVKSQPMPNHQLAKDLQRIYDKYLLVPPSKIAASIDW